MQLTGFKCPNGHDFEANAKLRARCPECGVLARRSFQKVEHKPEPVKEPDKEPVKEPEPEPRHNVKTPVLLRQGKPRVRKAAAKPAPKPAAKKVVAKPIGRVSGGIVKSTKLSGKVIPRVHKAPRKTAVARITSIGTPRVDKPYWEQVKDRYF